MSIDPTKQYFTRSGALVTGLAFDRHTETDFVWDGHVTESSGPTFPAYWRADGSYNSRGDEHPMNIDLNTAHSAPSAQPQTLGAMLTHAQEMAAAQGLRLTFTIGTLK